MSLKLTAGDLTIHRLIEQETTFLPALDLLPGLTPEVLAENRAWMQKAGALDAQDVLILCFQSYIVKTPYHTILIDSCIGNDKPRPLRPKWNMKTDDTYMRALAASGFGVADIDFVMCTHLHVDHVGWNTRLEGGRWVPTFPKARYVIVREEFEFWKREGETGREEFGLIDDSVIPVVEAGVADLVASDHVIDDRLRLEPAPGHPPAHVCVRLTTPAGQAIFTGDMMHRPIQVAEPEWNSRFCDEAELARKTRRGFLERHADSDVIVLAAHFPVAGRIVAPGGRTRFQPLAA